jgi:regulatory protein YycH of two-component signal transduction system YycFG
MLKIRRSFVLYELGQTYRHSGATVTKNVLYSLWQASAVSHQQATIYRASRNARKHFKPCIDAVTYNYTYHIKIRYSSEIPYSLFMIFFLFNNVSMVTIIQPE